MKILKKVFLLNILSLLSFFSLISASQGESSLSAPQRTHRIFLPKNYDQAPPQTKWPLLILLHGYGSHGTQMKNYFRLSKFKKAQKYLILIPEGTVDQRKKQFWNATPFCCDFFRTKVDDVAFLKNLIIQTTLKYSVDKTKIFVLGHSNGAFMANRLACEIPQMLNGIITLAGTGYSAQADCRVRQGLNFLHIHGTSDRTIRYSGAKDRYPGAQEMIQRWLKINKCDPKSVNKRDLDLAYIIKGKETEISEWSNCKNPERNKVLLFKMKGVGHVPWFKKSFLEETFNFMNGSSTL